MLVEDLIESFQVLKVPIELYGNMTPFQLLINYPFLESATFDRKREEYEERERETFDADDWRRTNCGNWSKRVDVAKSMTQAERDKVVKEYLASYVARL